MAQPNQVLGGPPPNYGLNPMNQQQVQQFGNAGGSNKLQAFSPHSFNAQAPQQPYNPPVNQQQQQQQQQQLQYQQRLMAQRIMNQNNSYPQQQPHAANSVNINAMTPQQRQQYILNQQQQRQFQHQNPNQTGAGPQHNTNAMQHMQQMQPQQPMVQMQHMQYMQQMQAQQAAQQPMAQMQPMQQMQTQPAHQTQAAQMQPIQAQQAQSQLVQKTQTQTQQPQAAAFNPYTKVKNPYAKVENPYAKVKNPYAKVKNPYAKEAKVETSNAKVKNPYAKVENPYAKVKNPYSKVENPYAKVKNPYAKVNTVTPAATAAAAAVTATAATSAATAANATTSSAAANTPASLGANTTAANNEYHPHQTFPTLPGRKFIDVSTAQWNDSLRQIRVVSFNVMPKNAHFKNKLQRNDGLQGYRTRPNYYSWTKRGPLLIEEITKKGAPDIICLQGVDQFEYFQEKLAPRGFVGVYERTQQPLLMKSVYFGDGLAIFWKTEKFELSGRRKFLLGDTRYVSNIALLARLKRRNVFINPLDVRSTKRNIIYESRIVFDGASVWLVLSTKYLYLFKDKLSSNEAPTLPQPLKHFNLDLYHEIMEDKDASSTSFTLKPKEKSKTFVSNLSKLTFTIADDNALNMKSAWVKNIKTAQIGIEIDVWNTRLIDGHSESAEYRRIKQCQVLFDCVSRASAESTLGNKNIGSSSYHMLHQMHTKTEVEKQKEQKEQKDLSELFKNMMEKRIQNKVDQIQKQKQEEQKTIQEKLKEQEQKEKEDKEKDVLHDIASNPTKTLHRPVILCCDIESNAWGDAQYQIPPLCYAYLTMRSRTTQNNALYAHSIRQLQSDPNHAKQQHSWFLQSAYALGFQQEPEFTTFNRYWPHEADSQTDPESHKSLAEQKKSINFTGSVEVQKCSDLVLFSPQHFRVLKLLEPMNKQWIYSKWNKTLPNQDYPSDHTMIGVQFELAIATQPAIGSSAPAVTPRTPMTALSPTPVATAKGTATNVNLSSNAVNANAVGVSAVAAAVRNTNVNINANALNANHVKNMTNSIATSTLPNTVNYTPHNAHAAVAPQIQQQQQQKQAAAASNPYQFNPFSFKQ